MERSMCKRFVTIERIILAAAAIGLLGWLFYADIVPSGKLEARNDFCLRSVRMSELYPGVRVGGAARGEDGECFRDARIEPVYFDVEIPRMFSRAKVIVKYRNIGDQPLIQIGIRKNGGGWNWAFKVMEREESDTVNYEEVDGWRVAEADFLLGQEWTDGRTVHFMISAPQLEGSGRKIRLGEIRVVLEREPLTPSNFWPRLKEKIGL